MLARMFMEWCWNVWAANMLTAMVLLCWPQWAVQAFQGATGDIEAVRKLSPVPKVALWLVMALMFVWLGEHGGRGVHLFPVLRERSDG